jgi:hypothetical protein
VNRDIAYLHRDFARFYDWTYEGLTEDIPFYLKAARDFGSPHDPPRAQVTAESTAPILSPYHQALCRVGQELASCHLASGS